ncbi:hypothetical protein L0Y46_00425 [bacterium]|nr:hypothetical protein [bacterium]
MHKHYKFFTQITMSKRKLVHMLKDEIWHINAEIDRKIIRGLPYRTDARRHRELLSQLRRLQKELHPSPFYFPFWSVFR